MYNKVNIFSVPWHENIIKGQCSIITALLETTTIIYTTYLDAKMVRWSFYHLFEISIFKSRDLISSLRGFVVSNFLANLLFISRRDKWILTLKVHASMKNCPEIKHSYGVCNLWVKYEAAILRVDVGTSVS